MITPFVPVPPPALRTATLVALALLAVGCSGGTNAAESHVGRVCELGVSDDAGAPGSVTINQQALECPSHICVLPGNPPASGTTSLCTARCAADSDCAGAETTAAATDVHCKHGFACRAASAVGDFACVKLCLCLDFAEVPSGATGEGCP